MGINGSKYNGKINTHNKFFCEFKGDSRKTISLPVREIRNVYNNRFIYYNIPSEELKQTTFNLTLKFYNYNDNNKNDECTFNIKNITSIKNIIDKVEYHDIKKPTEKGTFIYRTCTKDKDNVQIIYSSPI